MTEDKRKHIESCFDSVEKLVSLRRTLTESLDHVTLRLECAIDRLEMGQLEVELIEGEVELDDTDVEYINSQYTDSLWFTMMMMLPHYKTNK